MKYICFVLILIVLILTGFWSCNNSAGTSGNLGHRVGAGEEEHFSDLPENSISALHAVLNGRDGEEPLQLKPGFVYLEFDVQETADGEIVLFHDDTLTRMLPNEGANTAVYLELLANEEVLARINAESPHVSDLRIRHLTVAQLQRLALDQTANEPVPTLSLFLQRALDWEIVKPIASDIKSIVTDEGRMKLIELMADFKNKYDQSTVIFEKKYDLAPTGVSFLSFREKFKESYGESVEERQMWCEIFKEHGFLKVYRTQDHDEDLCDLQ